MITNFVSFLVFVEFSFFFVDFFFRRIVNVVRVRFVSFSAVAWGGYRNAGLISESDGEMLQKFDGKSFDEMLKLFDEKPDEHAVMLLRVIDSVNKEEAVRFLLAAISLFFKGTTCYLFFFLLFSF